MFCRVSELNIRIAMLMTLLGTLVFGTAVVPGQMASRDRGDLVAENTDAADVVRDARESKSKDPDKIDLLVKEIGEQKQMINKLFEIVSEQQKKIDELSAKPTLPTPVTALVDGEATPTASASTSQSDLESRVKKVEESVLKLGPFRFSGDARLTAEGIFRRAEPNPPEGFAQVPHVQLARMRYRFRFNIDTQISEKVSFHAQLSTGPINNPLTNDQDFTSVAVRHPFFISEAWINYQPTRSLQLQAGRVVEIFADNSRFMFDDDIRLNGFNQKYTWSLKSKPLGINSIEFRAGQYILSNPNVAIVTPGSPLALAGAEIGSTGRGSNLFHQGILVNHGINEKFTQQFGGDVQLYRNPNHIQLASTAAGAILIVYPGVGLTLSGPLPGSGTATTTPGGATYTARNFHIARLTYRLNYSGFEWGTRKFPVAINFQMARNIGTGQPERDAYLAAIQIGKITRRGDTYFTYVYAQKGANSLISQLSDDNIGTGSGANLRTHHFRFDYGLSKRVTWQSLIFIQNQLASSGDHPNFFVPFSAFTPRQIRIQEQLVFSF